MRPGAAVRLKGTWVDESRKQSASDGLPEASDAKNKSETSAGPEQPELKVLKAEVLGGSDPMVRPSEYLQTETYSHTSLDISNPEQISDTRKPSHDLPSTVENASQLHHVASTVRCHGPAHPVLLS
jgi:hypothetical protein